MTPLRKGHLLLLTAFGLTLLESSGPVPAEHRVQGGEWVCVHTQLEVASIAQLVPFDQVAFTNIQWSGRLFILAVQSNVKH